MTTIFPVKYLALRIFVVSIIFQCLALSSSWAADSPLPPVTWKYTFTLPQDQASKYEKSIQKAATKNNATVAYTFQEKGGQSAVQIVLDGSNTSVAQLNDIVLGANAGIKSLTDQWTKVRIKGFVAKQSAVNLVLTSNITTGHQWKLDPANLGVVDGNETGTYEQTSTLLGAAGRQTFVLNPLVSGNVAIVVSYGRHWETATVAAAQDSGTLDIQVNGSLPPTLDLSLPVTAGDALPPSDPATQDLLPPVVGSSTPLVGLPASFDLRTSGGLTGVKNQGQCGSCWAFATVGVLEGIVKINTGATVDLSEQFLVSCNRSGWSCNGGWWAHDYHKASGSLGTQQTVAGAVLEADKPYTGTNGTCTAIPNHPYSFASWGYVGTSSSVADTTAIKTAISTYGPVTAAVCVGNAFSSYTSGVFSTDETSTCSTGSVNHAIVLVGWDDATQSWLLRNSWGTGWGESGYMRIAYNKSNIGFGASYARYGNTCTYSIGGTSATATAAGGGASISVTASQSSCAWTASSNASWISLSSGSSGTGSGVVTYSVSPNSGSARSGTITVAGQTFTVTQAATLSCTYSTSPTGSGPPASGWTGTINVTTQSGCAWSTSNPFGWASIVSGISGTGSGTVTYTVSPNTGSARAGTFTIAGQTFTITQQASTQCTYSLNSISNSFSSSGGFGNVGVLSQSGCAWTATSGASWLTITSGASGTGSGTLSYSVSANTSFASRSGSLAIGGQTFTVNQLGASQGGDGQLSKGIALSSQSLTGSVSQGTWKYYSFTVPNGASNLVIDLYGLNGDLDLFGRQGSKPTTDIFSCSSYRSSSSNEQCVIPSPTPGTWWVGVNNYDIGTFSYTIKASWDTTSDTALTSGVAANGGVTNSPTTVWRYFYIDVPVGAKRLFADLYNLTGDADVYLKYGSKPDITSVDECDSVNSGTVQEYCDITNPAAGRWWFAVINYDPSATYSIKATMSDTAIATRLVNLSTRGKVQTGNNVMIGGFVIGGTTAKKVLIRAVGPNLANYGVTGVLADPMLELHRSSDGSIIASNDDWVSASNATAISATALAPVNSLESAILTTLSPGAYTAIVKGVGGGTGVGIVEVYDIDHPEIQMINISTRGLVGTGNDVMIGGFVIQGSSSQTVLIRAVGPNLANYGVTGVLANPTLELHKSSDGSIIASNDNWGTASNAAAIQATGLAPVSALESAILISLPPGAYTAIVSGVGGGTGVGIVEAFAQ